MKLRNDGIRYKLRSENRCQQLDELPTSRHQAVSRVDVFLRRAKHLALRSASIGQPQLHKSPCARSLFLRFRRDLDHEDDVNWSNRDWIRWRVPLEESSAPRIFCVTARP